MNDHTKSTENPIINIQSPDWHQARLEQLKQLMPDLFTPDGTLNIHALKSLIDPKHTIENERYGFQWFGKSQAKREAFTPSNATLVYDDTRSVNPDESDNIIIEGENLAVLKLLSNGYREQIKCIYIDPPYNTGKDFVYTDNFKQDKKSYWEDTQMTENGYKIDTNMESDGRFHSNWLNMMYSRLLVARPLLREDGVIFISIDDKEVHHLRKLCDEVFGERNFAGQIVWQTATDNNPTQVATEHEYVLCYLKNIDKQGFWEVPSEKGQLIQAQYDTLKKQFGNDVENIQTELRKWIRRHANTDDLSGVSHYAYVDEQGVFYPGNSANTKPGGYDYDIIHPITKKVCAKPNYGYRFPQKTIAAAAERGDVMWGKDETTIPKIKKRLDTVMQKLKSYYYEDNRATSAQLKKLMGDKKVFNNPKSVNFLKHVFKFIIQKNDIILDFFAGSGSTGQALTELNQADGGNRKYILVQLPEATAEKSEAYKAGYKKISDISIERNKRVIKNIIEENKSRDVKGLGFKVFKLQKSNFPRVNYAPNPELTNEENIELFEKYIREKEAQLVNVFNKNNIITEILLKNGFRLNYTLTKQKVFKHNEIYLAEDDNKSTLICIDASIANETVAYFKTHTDQKLIVLERALDTTKKWNLKHYMKDKFKAF